MLSAIESKLQICNKAELVKCWEMTCGSCSWRFYVIGRVEYDFYERPLRAAHPG